MAARAAGAGEEGDGADPFVAAAPMLAGLSAASVQGRPGLGRAAARRPRRFGAPLDDMIEPASGACHARWSGFDLHAGLLVPVGDRERLERVCRRYALRPPVSDERLRLTPAGDVVLQLRCPWDDGTTDLVFTPAAFLERQAALVPWPRVNLVLYHGVLAPRAAWRTEVVPWPASVAADAGAADVPSTSEPSASREAGRRWAELMRRAFGFDVLACSQCGRLRLIAVPRRVLERAPIHVNRGCAGEDRSLARRLQSAPPHGSLGHLTPDEYARQRQSSPTAEVASL